MPSDPGRWMRRLLQTLTCGVFTGWALACSTPDSPTGPGQPPGGFPVGVLVGAGDIARCGPALANAERTAAILDRTPGVVFTAGDNAYPSGRAVDFNDCYGPTWGRHSARTRPTPGNHEYETPGASAYFDFFGENAGPPQGHYTYNVGPWLVIALNSEIDVGASSSQLQWLRTELQESTARCAVAIFHRPLFSSGPNGDSRGMIEIWRALYEFGVELVINGHEHLYERFAPQSPDGRLDPRGIRQITVGTGGAELYDVVARKPHSEVVNVDAYGVLKLTLASSTYHWEFIPAGTATFRDQGSGACH